MALPVAKLMKKDERTLKEIRERCAAKPMETAAKLGFRKKLVGGLARIIERRLRRTH